MPAGFTEVEDAFVAKLQSVSAVTDLVESGRIQALPVPIEEFNTKKVTGKTPVILVANRVANFQEKFPGAQGHQDSITIIDINTLSYHRRQSEKHSGAVEIADAINAALFPDVQLTINGLSVMVVRISAETNLTFRGLARTLQVFQLEFTDED
jgi:hypothetical protein